MRKSKAVKTKIKKVSKIKNITNTAKISKSANKRPYILKPPLEVGCMSCERSITVLFCPPRQCYSHKNNWEWWTQNPNYEDSYKCDFCIIDMYKNRKYEYLKEITNSDKRNRLRNYLYNSVVKVDL